MSRWMAGGVLSALALAGTTIVAAPSWAGDEGGGGDGDTETFQGEATQRPVEALPGQQVTISDSSCLEGTTDIWWSLRPEEDRSVVLATGQVPLADDGSWELTLTAPDE